MCLDDGGRQGEVGFGEYGSVRDWPTEGKTGDDLISHDIYTTTHLSHTIQFNCSTTFVQSSFYNSSSCTIRFEASRQSSMLSVDLCVQLKTFAIIQSD